MRYNDDPKRPEMDGREYKMLCFLLMDESEMHTGRYSFCDERKALIPEFDDRYHQAYELLNGLVTDTINTIPAKQLERLRKELKLFEHTVKIKPVAGHAPEWILVKDTDLNEVLRIVIEDKCRFCDFGMGMDDDDQRKIKACPVRKALMNVAPARDLDTIGCPFGSLEWCTKDEMREIEREEEKGMLLT